MDPRLKGKNVPKIDNNQFERMFGFRPKPPMTKKQKERAALLNHYFDRMRDELEMDSRTIFREIADRKHYAFLRNVLACPEEIEEFCKQALTATSEERTRFDLVRQMRKPEPRRT